VKNRLWLIVGAMDMYIYYEPNLSLKVLDKQ